MAIKVLAVGKKHESWIAGGIERYEKRCKQPFNLEWVLLPHSSQSGDTAREKESDAILSRLKLSDYVVLCDEMGKNIDSPTLSNILEKQITYSKTVVIVIGGAYGVDERIKARADFEWSLSRLVFPHQLVRLIIAEQLYRAQEIAHGGKYHHI